MEDERCSTCGRGGPPSRLLDRRRIAEELGLPLSGAERLMRQLPKLWIGRRVYVKRDDLEDWLKRSARI